MIHELNEKITQALNKYYECFDDETWELIVSDEEFTKIEKELEEYRKELKKKVEESNAELMWSN